MPRTFPWHAKDSGVYHNNSECRTGKQIPPENLQQGTGGKALCKECADLNQKER